MRRTGASAKRMVCQAGLGLLGMAFLPAQEPFEASATEVRGGNLVVLRDGRSVRLQGVSLPAVSVRPNGFVDKLRKVVRDFIAAGPVTIEPDVGPDPTDGADMVAIVRRGDSSLNEDLIRRGLAVLSCRSDGVRRLQSLQAAAQDAQAAGAGWFAGERARQFTRREVLPFLNGAVLGLHYRDPARDYHRQIDELHDAGFRHVCLLFSAFLADATSVRIDRFHERTVRDHRLLETIRYAKSKRLSVMLLPIVLLLNPGTDDWRGNLRPSDERVFFLNYDEFLAHYLDIAEATGVEIFSVGSEYSSLESRQETWKRLIVNARGRFRGFLTYSANWDHAEHARFFDQLDLVGMTAYFSLTKKKDASFDELVTGWRALIPQLQAVARQHGKPVVFTELGYASQDGINTDPWNYVMNKDNVDLHEQADCFRAFLSVVDEMDFLRGAYLFDYFPDGGATDSSYSPRGKPAFVEWKRWAAKRR